MAPSVVFFDRLVVGAGLGDGRVPRRSCFRLFEPSQSLFELCSSARGEVYDGSWRSTHYNGGVLAVLFLLGCTILGGAVESPEIQGDTRVEFYLLNTWVIPPQQKLLRVSSNLVFYSDYEFDVATLTVTSCSSNARISIDGKSPQRVSSGDQFVASETIYVTEGWVKWKLKVSTTGGPSLEYVDVYEDEIHSGPPYGSRSKKLFAWTGFTTWFVIHIYSYGEVFWYEGHRVLFHGDHVFSLTAAWELGSTQTRSFEVRVGGHPVTGYDSGVKATMWKWTRK